MNNIKTKMINFIKVKDLTININNVFYYFNKGKDIVFVKSNLHDKDYKITTDDSICISFATEKQAKEKVTEINELLLNQK